MSIGRSCCFAALLALFVLPGCARQTASVPIEPGLAIELEDTPFYPQARFQCGPASLAMLLGASGVKTDPVGLASYIYLPGRKGSLQLELISASRRHGRIPYTLDGEILAVISELKAGRPVLVLQNLGLNIIPAYHYAVAIGVVPPDKIILRSGTTRRLLVNSDHFLATWRRAGSWGMIVLRPGELPATPDPVRFLTAVNAFETSGNIEQAEASYQAARAFWPKNQTAIFALGNNYLLQARYRKASSMYRGLLALNPGHLAAANNLAEALFQLGCYEEASAIIKQAAEAAGQSGSALTETILKTQQEILDRMDRVTADEDRNCTVHQ